MLKKLISVVLLFTSAASSSALELPSQYTLTTELAESILKEAHLACAKQNTFVSISIVDQHGNLVVFRRGEKAGPHSVKTSFRKAYTAASIKMPTAVLSTAVEQPRLSQLGEMHDDILLLTGGVPIHYQGSVVGGIGMSGAPSPELEEKCAITAIEKIMND